MMRTPKDVQEYQEIHRRFVVCSIDQMRTGTSVDAAAAGFKVNRYPGYKNERVEGAIQAVYDELQ